LAQHGIRRGALERRNSEKAKGIAQIWRAQQDPVPGYEETIQHLIECLKGPDLFVIG